MMKPKTLYDVADLYDLAHPDPWKGEVEFYTRLAEHYGQRVLELACGTGRITLPLARTGLTITGLDLSATMLARARMKAAQVNAQPQFVEGNMCDFHLGQMFDLIFIPINSICHLTTRAEVEGCFKCVREHLAPDGRFVVDVFNPSLTILSRDPQKWYEVGAYETADDQWIKLTEQVRYDRAAQINHITWRFERGDEPTTEVKFTMRQYFPQELEALLAYNGLAIEHKYGSYGQKEFHSESNQQLVVARAI